MTTAALSDLAADQQRTLLRRAVYALLIAISLSSCVARVMRVESADRRNPSPFLSANDRSRWATIRALGDHGRYEIDDIIFDHSGKPVRGWHTIDLVRHKGADGFEHYYSSKPTLLPTLLAGEYRLIKAVTGATLEERPFYVARCMLLLTNVLPLGLALWLLAAMIEGLGRTDWGRIFAVAAAAFGTFWTTFAVTLNNHTLAATTVVFTLAAAWPLLFVDNDGATLTAPLPRWRRPGWRFALAGLLAAFTAANELPALAFFCLVAMGLFWRSPLQTLLCFAPAAALVVVAALGTNYLAHGTWKTAYAHRHDGPVIATAPATTIAELDAGNLPSEIRETISRQLAPLSDKVQIEQRAVGKRWVLWDESTQTRLAIVHNPASPAGGNVQIRGWDNWYEYPGTYWTPDRLSGVDRGEPARLVYALHVIIGHHGLFSLTPIWLLSFVGLWLLGRGRSRSLRCFAVAIALLSIVVLLFYLSRLQIDRNYGGVTTGLRWMIWFAPLWLLAITPAVDRLSASRWGRLLALALLAVSVFSAYYGAENPWSHPWLFDYWSRLGWIEY